MFMIVLCIVGTEEETGGDGTGEVSTAVESESVVRRRRAVVTRRLVPLAGGAPALSSCGRLKRESESPTVGEGV